MGKCAGELSDFLVVTSDNPRTEDPTAIIDDIMPGVLETSCPYIRIENRAEAIKWAIKNAEKNDIIVLAGKGHETYQILKSGTIHFDEREVVREAVNNK
jgi:UDP-N-acetylmuramyl tripeptide synthase